MLVLLVGVNVQASELNNDFKELPEELSLDVTIGSIKDSIANYIEEQNLDIQYGETEYLNLMYDFLFEGESFDIPQVRLQYYGDYAAHYINLLAESNIGINRENRMMTLLSDDDKTLADIKSDNAEAFAKLQVPSELHVQPKTLYGAQQYVMNHYDNANEKYGYYITGDCTNFASQILHEGWGMPLNSEWNIFSSSEWAQRTWIVAQDFTEYWTNVKGYNGGLYTTRAQVNANATPGDFIAFMRKHTTEIYHVSFVQDKKMVKLS